MTLASPASPPVRARRVLVAAAALAIAAGAALGACSQKPTFVDDSATASGAGGGAGSGSSDASGAGGGGGSEPQCSIAADCPGIENECATRTCVDGICGMSFQPAGTPVGQQVTGDCKSNTCDGRGNVVLTNDDRDVPFDGNDCTQDTCSNGVPSNPLQPAGSPCGTGGMLTCNESGQCTGCTDATQCGASTECVQQACTNNVCYQIFVPDGGGDIKNQIPEDCKKIVCNGAGGTKTIEDATDAKPDGNACTLDFCSRGVPSYQSIPPQDDGNPCTDDVCNPQTGATDHPAKPAGTSCGACMACEGTACTYQCSGCDTCQNGQCTSACQSCETCQNGQCVSTCGNCASCVNGACQGGCGPCETCNGGQCKSQCGPCQQCDGGQCVGGCGPCQQCSGGQCVDLCGPCQTCQNGQCVSTCTGCQTCQGGQCVDSSAACPPCHSCQNGACVNECTAPCHTCINNVCTNACTGPCDYCYNNQCYTDYCCGDPCCGDPCCQPQAQPIPPPCL